MRERTRVHRAPAEAHESPTAPLSERTTLAGAAPTPTTDAPARASRADAATGAAAGTFGHSLAQLDVLPTPAASSPAGQPLPPDLAARFAASLGDDVDAVRLHADPASAALARSLDARAVTLGRGVHFAPGEYDPHSPAGQGLLAHEMVHVAQQARATERAAGRTPDVLEAEAALLAPRVAQGLAVRPSPAAQLAVAAQSATLAPPAAAPAAPVAATGSPLQAQAPADVNVGFNPMDITHRLLRAIDQSQIKFPEPKRHVDASAVIAALGNLTAAEVREVRAAYHAHEKSRTLDDDLFGMGESGFPSDLKPDQQLRIKALLGGTTVVAGTVGPEADAAAAHQREADAAELHALLHGDRGKAQIERVMTMLRRGLAANAALGATYEQLYDVTLPGDLARLGPTHLIRALSLFMGRAVEADRMAVGVQQSRIAEIDKRIPQLQEDGGLLAFGDIQRLQAERKKLVAEIEQRTEASVAEGRSEVAEAGGDAAAVDQAGQSRAVAVLGDVEAAAATVGGADAAVVRAIASGDPVAKAAAELRKAAAANTISASLIGATLRGLREQAEARAKLEHPGASADALAANGRIIADDYFRRLRDAYDGLAGTGLRFDALLDETGSDGDAELNRALVQGRGQLSDVEELVRALAGDRKDTATVERVLKYKSALEIKILKAAYVAATGGRTLDRDLFGEAPTTSGGENPEMLGQHLKEQGKASGTSRLTLEDYLQRPDEEGGLAEVQYIASRAEREYEYTIETGGATGAWRDAWGNEERSLLDETIREARRLTAQYTHAAMADPRFTESGEAKRMVHELRLARATIRGDRAAYEQATAELRATFQAIAAFALEAALTAVLGPLAQLGRLAKGASMALKVAKAAQAAAVSTAATIGANMAVYGKDYSLAMLKADLLGGLGGPLGPAGVDRLLGAYAKAMVDRLGPRASAELVALSKTVAGMETAALAQGGTADLSLEGIAKAHLTAKGGDVVTSKVQGVLGMPPPADGASAERGAATDDATTAPARDAASDHAAAAVEPSTAATLADPPAAAAREADAAAALRALPPDPPATLHAPGTAPPASDGADAGPKEARRAGEVAQAADPHHPVAAWTLYRAHIAADPRREVALVYNHALDQWAVVQGDRGGVPIAEAIRSLGWPPDHSIEARHSHPVGAAGQTAEASVLPSGRGGDIDVVASQAAKREPGTSLHAIDVVGPGGVPDRTFVVHSPATGLWTVDFPDAGEPGGRGRVSFASVEQYHRWFEHRFGISADTTARAVDGAAPTLHAPTPDEPTAPRDGNATPEPADASSRDDGEVERERRLLLAEIEGDQSLGDAQADALSRQVAPETRLSESSASRSRKALEHHINASDASASDKAAALAAVDRLLAAALRETDGDRIFDRITAAQAEVNRLIRDGTVTIDYERQLQTHHDPEVHEHPGTHPKTFRARTRVPEAFRAAIDRWAGELTGLSAVQRAARRRELARLVRDSLTQSRADSPTGDGHERDSGVLEEIDLTVTTGRQHRETHRRRGDDE